MRIIQFTNGNIEIITKQHKDGTYEGYAIYINESGYAEGYVKTAGNKIERSYSKNNKYIDHEVEKL